MFEGGSEENICSSISSEALEGFLMRKGGVVPHTKNARCLPAVSAPRALRGLSEYLDRSKQRIKPGAACGYEI